jgi:hypothetical protein
MGNPNLNPYGPDFPDFIQRFTQHEIGHTMGLDDQPAPGGYCYGQVAGESAMNYACGTNDNLGYVPSAPTQCDVAGVDNVGS